MEDGGEGSVEDGSVEDGGAEDGSVEEGSVEDGSVEEGGNKTRQLEVVAFPVGIAIGAIGAQIGRASCRERV